MIDYYLYSHIGDRDINEDSIGVQESDNGTFFIVADGLGGHGKGDLASQLVVLKAKEFIHKYKKTKIELCSVLQYCQDSVMKEQIDLRCYSEMKTTMVILRIDDKFLQWAHIGDSRLYFFNRKRLICRTSDHSVPQMMVYAGEIKEKDIRHHEDRNKLLRVIGTEWDCNPCEQSKTYKRKKDMAFLLCTDGFWENIDERQMRQCLKKAQSAKEWMLLMEKIVRENGRNMDNNSAISIAI